MGLPVGTKLGPYEIVAPLGAGGMGEVYRARDTKLSRDVAVKVLPAQLSRDPVALARFEREATALAATSHPNILTIFDFGAHEGLAYVVTELLEGHTLRGLLADGPVPAKKVIEYCVQIADGLAAAHDRGIVHRDLKPDNLFVTGDGRVKILDFGLARQHGILRADDVTSPAIDQTEPGTVLGTIGYMSPEQVRGKPADARSDIFSFGALMYEMLAGRRAFTGESAADTMHAVLKENPPDLVESARGLSPSLERIVNHCLEKSPDQRFQSARDLAFDLRSLSMSSSTRERAVATTASARPRLSRPVIAAALIAVGIALGIGVDRILWRPTPSESPAFHRLTFDRGTVGRARFAPDGETVVYNAAWRGEQTEVFTLRIGARESRPLGLRGAVVHAVSSEGELAVGLNAFDPSGADGSTLGRVPLAGGAPREVAEDVTWADWSPGGSDLAIVVRSDQGERVEFPAGKTVYQAKGSVSHLRVSPAGDKVAFIEHPADSPFAVGSLVVVDRTGANKTLTRNWADLWGAGWRPDGREVWFTAAKRGEFKVLRAVTLDGEERLVARTLGQVDLQDVARDGRVLVTHPDFRIQLMALPPAGSRERELTWLGVSAVADISADASRVLFTELDQGAGGAAEAVYLRPTDGSPAVRLGAGTALSLSPDGKWALCLLSSATRLVALPTGAGSPRELTRKGMNYVPMVPGVMFVRLGAWFPDSRRVLFLAQRTGEPFRAFVQDLEGGEPRAVGPASAVGVTVSPDGRMFLAFAPNGRGGLYPVDGGEPTPCCQLQRGERPIRWGQDARSLICRRDNGLTSTIFLLDIPTGRRKQLWELSPLDLAGTSGLAGIAVTPDARAYAYSVLRDVSDLYLVDGLK